MDSSSSGGASSKPVGGVFNYKRKGPYQGRTRDQQIEDFINHIDRSAGSNGCWVWKRGTTFGGYGCLNFNRKTTRTHRLMWILTTGPIPPDVELCHTCDNPPCCNPNHLFPGTHLENMQDMHKKNRNRQPKGERNAWAKLTAAKVTLMRELYASGRFSFRSLAKEFGVSKTQARYIVHRRKWKHVK